MSGSQRKALVKSLVELAVTSLGIPGSGVLGAGVDMALDRVFPGVFGPRSQTQIVGDVHRRLEHWATHEFDKGALDRALKGATEILRAHPLRQKELLALGYDADAIAEELIRRAGRSGDADDEVQALRALLRDVYDTLIARMGGAELVRLHIATLVLVQQTAEQVGDLADAHFRRDAQWAVTVAGRAKESTTLLLAREDEVVGARVPYWPHELVAESLALLDREDWHQRVGRDARVLGAFLDGCGMDSLRLPLDDVTLPAASSVARMRVRLVPFDAIEHAVRSAPAPEGPDEAPDTRWLESRRRALAALSRLRGEAATPRHEDVLAISGGWGSGRTRLAIEVSRAYSRAGRPVVYARLAGATSLAGALTLALARAWGEDAGDVPTILGRARLPVLLVLDDFDELLRIGSSALDELVDLVDRTGGLPGIRWLLTCDAERLGPLLARPFDRFWVQHGPRDQNEAPVAGGWLHLDVANEQNSPGLQVLRRSMLVSGAEAAFIDEVKHDEHQASVFRDPLPAWFVVEAGSAALGTIDLRQEAVVAAYWDQRLRDVRARFGPAAFDDVVALLASLFARSADLTFTREDLDDGLDKLAVIGAREVAAGVVQALVETQVLVIDGRRRYAPPTGILHVWARFVAGSVTDEFAGLPQASRRLRALRRWIDGYGPEHEWLARAVAHFALLRRSGPRGLREAEALWKAWYLEPGLPNSVLYSAAALAGPALQHALADLVRREPRALADPTDTYLYLRFFLTAAPEAIDPMDRLRGLLRTYPLVSETGLGGYLAFVFDRCLSRVPFGPGEFEELLGDAYLTEKTGQVRAMCYSLVDRSFALHQATPASRTTWLKRILGWLTTSTGDAAESFGAPAATGRDRRQAEVMPAWVHVVERAVDAVVRCDGIDAWEQLRFAGWLSRDLGTRVLPPIARRVRAEIHVKVGHLAWEGGDVVPILESLLEGRATDEERAVQAARAFFIVRHTVPVVEGTDADVSAEYAFVLERVAEDEKAIRAIGTRYAPELQRMLERFAKAGGG